MGREKGQSRETGNIGYTRRRTKTHKTKNTSLYTNYVNKIWTLDYKKPSTELGQTVQ
jgi:hypothetical protein